MWGVRLGIWSQVLRNRVAQGTGLCVRCRRLVETGSTQRRSSSAVPKDKVIAYDRGRMELLEVLEIREKQLQADEYLPLHETKNNKLCAQKEENAQSKKVLNTNQTSKHGKKMIQKDETTESHVKENVKKRQTKLPVEPSHCQPQNDKGKTIEKKTLKTDKDPTDHKNPRQLLNYKQQEFHCYLETCLFLGLYEKAKKSLYNCVQNPSTHPPFNVSMFNLFIKYWARKGALQETGLYFKLLNKVGLKPNLESYAAALEAFGRNEKQMEGITRCIKQMEADGFSLDQLFHDLPYYGDERQKVLEAIRRVKPSFKPKIKAPKNHPLSDNFYNKLATRSYPKMDFTASFLQERFEEQLQMERNSSITIDSVEAVKPLTDAKIKARDVLASLRSAWRQDLLLALQDLKRQQKKGLSWNSNFIYHYLFLLEEEHYVDAMLQCLTSIPPLGESYSFICRDIGLKIYNRFVILQQLQDYHINKIRLTYNEYCKLLSKEGKDSGLLPREIWENSAYQIFGGSSYLRTNLAWPRSLVMRLGTLLGELMVKTIKMKNDLLSPRSDPKLIPVLYHLYSFRSVQQIGLLIPHPSYIQILQDAEETQLTFDAAFIPMKCPPLPWMSPQSGPYLLSPSQFMRATEGTVQHQGLLEKCPSGQLNPVLDAVTQLGLCPWRINQPILDIIISIFNDKGNEKLDIPPPLSEAPVVQGLLPGMMSIVEKQEHEKEKLRCRKKASEMYSLRVSALYSLSIANYLRDQVFWLPHNMDFRGRTYPCPPYLNHLGSDVTRSLMVFAEGHPLGPKGLDWLKIHLINLTGLKKRCSLQQRKEYAEEIMEDILDSADHPLNGRKWWMESDEPWQTLACCMEIAKAIRSPDPEKYICHFPVHQDGSCNGLQHYAALGRDEVGAKSVNLTPCINPQDVYSEVAEKVEALRKEDAKQGNDIARVLEGFIGRKIVKQTVMTVVYGVTRFGGRLQIEKRLRETESFPQKYVWSASHYLVDQVFHALAKMFTNTREIQYWLTECARLISKSGKAVEWVTPVGLPIIQPYHQVKPVNIKVGTQAVGFKLKSDVFIKPNTLKQKNAFPPNFIHSLDSTHMMLTALYCYARGLTFVSVHDCFWTHADTVDIMNKVCREQFVSLHSEPILKDLSDFLLQKYCSGLQNPSAELQELEKLIKKIPETGSFELSNVLDSTYFFS